MGALSERQRTALELAVSPDHSRAEAAAAMGLTPNGYDQLLHRARMSFRRHFDWDAKEP